MTTSDTTRRGPRVRAAAATLVLAVAGATAGLTIGATHTAGVGPFVVRLALSPALDGQTVLDIPPLGAVALQTHDGPVLFSATVVRLRPEAVRAIAGNPVLLDKVAADTQRDLRRAAWVLALRAVGAALLGAALAVGLAFRSVRRTVLAALTAGFALVGAGTAAKLTYNPQALDEPRYTGLLASAPAVVGNLNTIAGDFDKYRAQIGRLVTTVSGVYAAGGNLPVEPDDRMIRVLHVADMHLNPEGMDVAQAVARQFRVDLVIDSGDLTDHGSPPEDGFANRIAGFGVPYAYVRGNHDGPTTTEAVARQPNAVVLDGQTVTVAGVRLIGGPDPLFTPDKSSPKPADPKAALAAAGRLLAAQIGQAPATSRPWLAVVHSPAQAAELDGHVPLVLAGHAHERSVFRFDGTIRLVQGSTGGAGLRGVEQDTPTSIQMTVLYLDRNNGVLRSYDNITVGGLGLASVSVNRHQTEAIPERAGGSQSVPRRGPAGGI